MVCLTCKSCACLLQAVEGLAAPIPAALDINSRNNSFPANVSGTYRGTWNLQQPSNAGVLPLTEVEGSVSFQLSSQPSNTDEVQDIEVNNVVALMNTACDHAVQSATTGSTTCCTQVKTYRTLASCNPRCTIISVQTSVGSMV